MNAHDALYVTCGISLLMLPCRFVFAVLQWVPMEQHAEALRRCGELASQGQSLIASLRSTRADLDAVQTTVVQQAELCKALTQVCRQGSSSRMIT